MTASLGGAERIPGRSGLHAEAGLSPLQLFENQAERNWDARASATVDRSGGENEWGAGVAAGPILHPWGGTTRLLPEATGQWTSRRTAAGVRIGVETAKFVSGTSQGGGEASTYWGEAGIGLYLEVDRAWDMSDSWLVHGGVTLRVPATIGLVSVLR